MQTQACQWEGIACKRKETKREAEKDTKHFTQQPIEKDKDTPNEVAVQDESLTGVFFPVLLPLSVFPIYACHFSQGAHAAQRTCPIPMGGKTFQTHAATCQPTILPALLHTWRGWWGCGQRGG